MYIVEKGQNVAGKWQEAQEQANIALPAVHPASEKLHNHLIMLQY